MVNYIFTITLLFSSFLFSCKHNHAPPSETLQKAFEIQKEALADLKYLDVMIDKLPAEVQSSFTAKKKLWQDGMIEIEGMDHDHSQCDGDHSKKRFSIPDEDMLIAQKEWRDSIVSLKNQIMNSLKSE